MMRRVSRAEDKYQIGKRHNIVHILKEVFIKKKLINKMVNWYAIESFVDYALNRTMKIPKTKHQIRMIGFVHFVR